MGRYRGSGILEEAWVRYGRPLAITEVHLGCTREEQMRWLLEVWESATELHRGGVDIRAVTAWALLGSYDWNSLLTRFEGHYEPGAFDLRGGAPRPTALAHLLREITHGEKPSHPVLATPGWWRQPQRILYHSQPEPPPELAPLVEQMPRRPEKPARPILITGARGTLGYAFARLCHHRNLAHVALSREELDITQPGAVETAIRRYRPWAVLNAAGYAHVDEAQRDEERCLRTNSTGPGLLATVCAREGIALLTFSSDQVFSGRQAHPYVETDPCGPLMAYGRSKARAEQIVHATLPSALIVRTGALFGPWDPDNFVTMALQTIAAGRTFQALEDVIVSPTYVPDLVHACLDLLNDGESGIWHLANQGAVTWRRLAEMAAERAGFDPARVEGCRQQSLGPLALRPRYSVLGSVRGPIMQPLGAALDCYFRDCGVNWPERARATARVHEQETGCQSGRYLALDV